MVYDAGVDAYRAGDYAVARVLWRRAAELGDHAAESNLGFLLYYGHGGAPDTTAAVTYWAKAMSFRDAEAHRHVAQAILDGDVSLGSDVDAYSHLVAARTIALGSRQPGASLVARDADALRQRLLAYLPRTKIARADSVGRGWSESYEEPSRSAKTPK